MVSWCVCVDSMHIEYLCESVCGSRRGSKGCMYLGLVLLSQHNYEECMERCRSSETLSDRACGSPPEVWKLTADNQSEETEEVKRKVGNEQMCMFPLPVGVVRR